MCGIFAYISPNKSLNPVDLQKLREAMNQIKHRGPDSTKEYHVFCTKFTVFLGFHRLAINGLTEKGDQPMTINGVTMICNGEIYNFRQLAKKYKIVLTTGSDCEIIPHLYQKIGIEQTLKQLDGVFAFVLYDNLANKIIAANDILGVRPLYHSQNSDGTYCYASEQIALRDIADNIQFFKPATYQINGTEFQPYYDYNYDLRIHYDHLTDIYQKLRTLMEKSVKKRLLGERRIGSLLSGGIDSSFVAAILAKLLKEQSPDQKLSTFSIGMEGSPDLFFARKVAEFIGSDHHEILVTQQQMLDAIPETIKIIGSYDTTSVRASVGNALLGKYISQNTDIKIVFNGDIADEIFGSYYYFSKAPNLQDYLQENIRLIKQIHRYDVLRSDRCISHWGLEPRSPFEDKELIDYVMTINPRYKHFTGQPLPQPLLDAIPQYTREQLQQIFNPYTPIELPYQYQQHYQQPTQQQTQQQIQQQTSPSQPPTQQQTSPSQPTDQEDTTTNIQYKFTPFSLEKMCLRLACADYLPPEVAFRPKTAFSDGVSDRKKSWHEIVQDYIATKVTQEEFQANKTKFHPPYPQTLEAYYYRKIYHEHFGNRKDMTDLIGQYWMPRFIPNITDPSARVLTTDQQR